MPPDHRSRKGLPARKAAHQRRQAALRADVDTALSAKAPSHVRLQSCADALVRHLDAAAARIWLLTKDGRTLVLQANSGAPLAPGRGELPVPVASPALRSVVEEGVPYITQDAVRDPHLKSLAWAPGETMAYAGYPILAHAQTIGVLALFSRTPITTATLETLHAIADSLAHAVRRTQVTASSATGTPLTETQRLSALVGSMRRAIDRTSASLNPQMQVLRGRYESLTLREQEVMALVVNGRLNKQVGAQLGISEITVKEHRGQVMRKMNAPSFADLVKIAVLLQIAPSG